MHCIPRETVIKLAMSYAPIPIAILKMDRMNNGTL